MRIFHSGPLSALIDKLISVRHRLCPSVVPVRCGGLQSEDNALLSTIGLSITTKMENKSLGPWTQLHFN